MSRICDWETLGAQVKDFDPSLSAKDCMAYLFISEKTIALMAKASDMTRLLTDLSDVRYYPVPSHPELVLQVRYTNDGSSI